MTLPGTAVTGVAIISISPESQNPAAGRHRDLRRATDQPNRRANHVLRLQTDNVIGYAISDFNLNSNQPDVTVGPEATVDVPLQVTSDLGATLGDNSFTVTASDAYNSNGASGSVQGNLTIAGQPITQSNPNAYGVVATLTPAQATAGQGTSAQHLVQLTNTGSADDTFSLPAVSGLPAGVTASLGRGDDRRAARCQQLPRRDADAHPPQAGQWPARQPQLHGDGHPSTTLGTLLRARPAGCSALWPVASSVSLSPPPTGPPPRHDVPDDGHQHRERARTRSPSNRAAPRHAGGDPGHQPR